MEKSPSWHPMMAAVEPSPSRWLLIDASGREYGEIRLIRSGGEVGYKAKFRGELVGHYTTFKTSCEMVHQAFISSHAPGGAANGRRAADSTGPTHTRAQGPMTKEPPRPPPGEG